LENLGNKRNANAKESSPAHRPAVAACFAAPAGISQAARTKGPLTAIGQLTARSLRIAAVAASRKATIELSMEVSIAK
jgi:hypothetical protein